MSIFFVARKQLDLCHVGHTQQLLAHIVGKRFDFGRVKAVGLRGVNHAAHIAKIIIEK